MPKKRPHSFHIPVMGTGYTIDTPIKVAHYGISSVISIIDHRLSEQMREYYSKKYNFDFKTIDIKEHDCRARRVTAYLNLVKAIVERNFDALKQSAFEKGSEITKYFEMLADSSPLKNLYNDMQELSGKAKEEAQKKLRELLSPGSIDVNIMTKLDGPGLITNKKDLGNEFNDAHAALRGYANSDLESSVIFSAGLNPRLYSYMANFDDFFPDEDGNIKKKVVLKVSDYRSALIQGKFLAKKGIWVSEYRVESGLNCGGHAFATDGYLMGPILKEFNENKETLYDTIIPMVESALESQGRSTNVSKLTVSLTVQGGVGNHDEHEFLRIHENVDSVGWGSPFLLVPEAVTIDQDSINTLLNAKENDFYLSRNSPLGIRFNTVRNNSAEIERDARVDAGKPGAPCIKKHLALSETLEGSTEPICTASVKYQKAKIDELVKANLPDIEFKEAFTRIVEKVCLCVGLGNGAAINKDYEITTRTKGVAICPGPNLAYFKNVVSLKDMVDHIYGRINLVALKERPNMFIKELELYMNYLKENIDENLKEQSAKNEKYIQKFISNLEDGINYYEQLFDEKSAQLEGIRDKAKAELERIKTELVGLQLAHAVA